MGFLALFLVVIAAWLVWTGRLQRMTTTDGMMLGLAIVGAIMAARGKPIMGGVPLAVSAFYALRRFKSPRIAQRPQTPPPRAEDTEAVREARALLGLEADADEEAVRAAHRRLIAKTHPDAGGTQALAEKINQARDIMLRHIHANSQSHPEQPS
tara:strand:+ start:37732 stop:38193 length:462 start_codon:yes stop_codon:yes gene_type:complete